MLKNTVEESRRYTSYSKDAKHIISKIFAEPLTLLRHTGARRSSRKTGSEELKKLVEPVNHSVKSSQQMKKRKRALKKAVLDYQTFRK